MKRMFVILVLNWIICAVCMAQSSVDLKLNKNYLNLPVSYNGDDDVKLELVIGDEVVRDFDIFLPDSDPDFWVFLDISEYGGKKAVLRTENGKEKKGLDLVYQSDERKYLKNVYKEKLRPQIHFSTMRGWINDPNGLLYYDGEYHLFYQHNPYGFGWGNMHWGHAVSTDLLHWKQLPEALYPDEVGVAFSGCAVIDYKNTSGFKTGDEDVMVAIYTSTFFPNRKQRRAGLHVMERQSLAYSNDKGRTWTKYKGNPVIGDRSEILGTGNDRDPNVFWHEPTNKWVMILFERIGLSIFTSDNLKEWKHESHFQTFWECPELFELPVDGDPDNTKWVTYGACGDYAIGHFDGKKFTMEKGPYNYVVGDQFAAQTYENIPKSDGRQIQIGWGVMPSPGMPFNMMMCFPTELTLRTTNDGIRMFNEPVKEIEKLHSKEYKWKNLNREQANEKLSGINADTLHVKCEIENVNAIAYSFDFGGDTLEYSIRGNQFQFNDEEKVFKYLPELGNNKMTFEIILDKTSIEVFVDDGRFTMILPRKSEPETKELKIVLRNDDHVINIKSMEVYDMESIW